MTFSYDPVTHILTISVATGRTFQYAVIHYFRDDGDPTSSDFNDFWGMHVWDGALTPNPSWQDPVRPARFDGFGAVFEVPLVDGAPRLAHILHRGDEKHPGPDQFLVSAVHGYEIRQLQGADPADPYLLPILGGPIANPGNIAEQAAYWVNADTIAWAAGASAGNTFTLHWAPDGGLAATDTGITGGSYLTLTPDPAGLPADVQAKFPHLAALPALKIAAGVLNAGQGNALLSKLRTIQDKIARGAITAAINELGAFINQVEAFMAAGIPTPQQGAALIAAAQDILAVLTS